MMPMVVESTMTSKLIDFVTMNHLIFLGTKINEDPKSLLIECAKF